METDRETVDRLARIETKLDTLMETRGMTEERLSRLERFMWGAIALGGAGGIPTVVGLLGRLSGQQ